jgi:hypothetical protein
VPDEWDLDEALFRSAGRVENVQCPECGRVTSFRRMELFSFGDQFHFFCQPCAYDVVTQAFQEMAQGNDELLDQLEEGGAEVAISGESEEVRETAFRLVQRIIEERRDKDPE